MVEEAIVLHFLHLLGILRPNILNLPVPHHPSPVLSPLPAHNLSKEHAVQSQHRKVLPLLMMKDRRHRLPKSTNLTDHLKALVEVQEEWQSDQD